MGFAAGHLQLAFGVALQQAHLHVLPAVQMLAGGVNTAWRSVATVSRRDRSSNWLVCAWVSRSACNWRRWRAARLPVSAAISRKNTKVSTSSSRWMLNEKLGGMNRKS